MTYGLITKGNGEVILTAEKHMSISCGGGQAGQGYPCIFIEREDEVMLHITFEYRDALSHGNWNRQECCVSSVQKCKEIYGLGVDCEYRIISVEEVGKDK